MLMGPSMWDEIAWARAGEPAWRVLVDSDLVAVWQLYANQHSMHEILKRISAA